jgi:transcriptional antiterminator RfaH
MNQMSSPRGHIVQTQVNCEVRAARNLIRQGYDVYLPRYPKRRRHARKVDLTVKPLFPRYMFVAFDMATLRWRSIQSTFGVSRLVSDGDDPATLPAAIVTALGQRED